MASTLGDLAHLDSDLLQSVIKQFEWKDSPFRTVNRELRKLANETCERVRLSHKGVEQIERVATSLTHVKEVFFPERLSDELTAKCLRALPPLVYVRMRYAPALAETCRVLADRSGKNLLGVDFGKCDVTDADIDTLTSGCGQMRVFTAWGCEKLSDDVFARAAGRLRNLRRLSLSHNPNVTPATLNQLFAANPNLLVFFAPRTKFNDECARALADKCKHLGLVVLNGCDDVTEDGLAKLCTLPKLRFLLHEKQARPSVAGQPSNEQMSALEESIVLHRCLYHETLDQ